MNFPSKIDECLPFEMLQKDFKISEDEIKSHASLKLTVNKFY